MTPRHWKLAALALPVVVLLAMVARAEWVVRAGRVYEVDITGYDPRDLLRGHYLRFRVAWNLPPEEHWFPNGSPNSCLCLLSQERLNPPAEPRECSRVEECTAFIRGDAARNLEQFFIPEGMGTPLEQAIRERRAAVRISVSSRGSVVLTDLLLDGRPWRDVVPP